MKEFKTKTEVYAYLNGAINQNLIITGSTALQLYGLTEASSEKDLDLIIYNPTPETKEKVATLQYIFFDDVQFENEKFYEDREEELGSLKCLKFLVGIDELSVHIFYIEKKKLPSIFTVLYNGFELKLPTPASILKAKKYLGRRKDNQQLLEICSTILK